MYDFLQGVASDVERPVPRAGTPKATGSILSEPPEKASSNAKYLSYLHGRIVQEQGRGAVSRHAEIRLDTRLHHGFPYRPLPEWTGPVIRWALERASDAPGSRKQAAN